MGTVLTSVGRRATILGLLIFSASAGAQLPNASAAAFGMGGNFTAIARGYEAVAWNPANLAMPHRPLFSLGVLVAGGSAGLDPVDATMLHSFSGQVIDSATRASWVDQVRLAGGQRAHIDGGLTPIALSIGPVGIQVGSSTFTNLNLSPDAWEAMLFGNAGNNGGQPKSLDLTGTSIRAGVISTAAMSFAFPIPINLSAGLLRNEHAAIGITGKYVMGNALVIAQDIGSVLADSLQLQFPMIQPDSNYNGSVGNGVGVDVGLAWQGGPWKIGINAENVFNSFRWDTTVLATISGVGTFSTDSNSTDFSTQRPFSAAPAPLRDIVTNQQFKPAVTLGAAFQVLPSLVLTGDIKQSFGDDNSIQIGPKSRMGVGVEWRPIPFIPLRAGVASVTDGWQAGAGAGLRFFGYELGASASIRHRGVATESGVMIGLIGIGR